MPDSSNLGLIHIYCGNGKGKTTCGMGLCVRAAGFGFRVLIYQFMKNNSTSEPDRNGTYRKYHVSSRTGTGKIQFPHVRGRKRGASPIFMPRSCSTSLKW